jgi:hypothetical protein
MIDIDFSGRAPARPLGWALLGAGALALAWQGWGLWRATALAATPPAVQAAAQATAPVVAPAASPKGAPAVTTAVPRPLVDAVVADLAAPWEDLLRVFETRAGQQVAVLRLEPDARSGLVRLAGEARTLSAVLAYAGALDADPRLSQVLLTHHQRRAEPVAAAVETASAPPRPAGAAMIEFTLTAAWRPLDHPAPRRGVAR